MMPRRRRVKDRSPAKGSASTPGKILAALTEGEIGGEAYDRELPARQRATLY